MRVLVLSLLAAAAPLGPVLAVEPLEGWFIAREACEAFQSKNKGTNPGEVMTEPLHAYAMIALNAPGGDFFQVKVPGAPVTEDRWVHVSCGLHVVEAGTPTAPCRRSRWSRRRGRSSASNLLALSWQPAFCELKPGKTECEQLNAGELPVTETQLSLHGLWPQPRGKEYCGVPAGLVALDRASRWAELPEVAVDADTRELLAVAMPGTASFLERHEWIKHGTCFLGAGGADEYYDDTLRVVEAINASPVAALLAGARGGRARHVRSPGGVRRGLRRGGGGAGAGALRRRPRPDADPGGERQPRRRDRAGDAGRGADPRGRPADAPAARGASSTRRGCSSRPIRLSDSAPVRVAAPPRCLAPHCGGAATA